MHIQSLQAHSQFFLKLQAQLASQASTGPGHQVEAVQASQVTFTQRVETTYSKSPEKLNQVFMKKNVATKLDAFSFILGPALVQISEKENYCYYFRKLRVDI